MCQEKRIIRNSRREEKVVSFSLASLFLTRKWEAVTQKENPLIQYCQRLGGQVRLRAHSRYIHIKQE